MKGLVNFGYQCSYQCQFLLALLYQDILVYTNFNAVQCVHVFLCCINPVPEPEPATPSLGPPPFLLYPTSPALPYSSTLSSGNGKRASSSGQQTTPTPPQQQCQLSSASARYPPREVPPRFRQQEHKQLLKRGQPLPVGALGAPTLSSSSSSSSSSSTTTNGTNPNSTTTVGKQHSGLFHTSRNVQKQITLHCFYFTIFGHLCSFIKRSLYKCSLSFKPRPLLRGLRF